MHSTDIWSYRGERDLGVDIARGVDITGFAVEALDGTIGKVDEASYDVGASQIVVDTGPWIFGKKVLLPAGVIDRIDLEDEKIYVHRTKDQIKNAPEYDDSLAGDESYRGSLDSYYSEGGAGWRSWDDRAI
jgi:hypothetical protein